MFGRSDSKIREFTKLPRVKFGAGAARDDARPTPNDDRRADRAHAAGDFDDHSAPAPRPEHEGHVLIGAGVRIVGEIRDCRKFEIHGTMEGDLEAEELIVHENGVLKGSIKADRAQVNGAIDGDVSVTHLLEIRAKGSVAGTTRYGELSIETGGRIVGTLDDRLDRNAKRSGVSVPKHAADMSGSDSASDFGFTHGFTPRPISS